MTGPLRLLDATAGFGPYRTRVFRFATTAADLLEEMDFCGIDTALVYHTAQRFDLAPTGNQRLIQEIHDGTTDRLRPTWAILPTATGEQVTADELLKQMRNHNVRALRLFPNDHRYFLDALSWQDQLPIYAERHIPLFVKAGLNRVADLLRAFPSATIITDTQGANPLDRYAWPLLDAYPNLYYETSGYLTAGAIEAFCERFGPGRLLFSSGFPDYPSGAALLTLAGADIPVGAREAIAGGNLDRLLAEVEL
jgi:uncharacterized protein